MQEKNCPELRGGEVYSPPPTATAHDTFTAPSARIPLENKHYKLMETPFLKNLRAALDESTLRPVTFHNRQRHALMIACIEQLALPVILVNDLSSDNIYFYNICTMKLFNCIFKLSLYIVKINVNIIFIWGDNVNWFVFSFCILFYV